MPHTPLRYSIPGIMLLILSSVCAFAQESPVYPFPSHYTDMPFIRYSRHLDTSGAWMPQSGATLKMFVKEDGVYAITADFLRNYGISPSSLDVSRIRLVRNGVTIPIVRNGLEDGTFEDGDGIYFIGTRNYDDPDYYRKVEPSAPHPQYLNKYSDSSAYWLIFGDFTDRSPQMPVRDLTMAQGDTVTTYWKRQHYEREVSLQFLGTNVDRLNLADWTSEDTWIAMFIQPDETKTLQFELEHYVPDRDPVIRLSAAGYQGPSGITFNHKLSLGIKDGAFLDSLSFNTSEQILLTGTVEANQLTDGAHLLEVSSEVLQSTYTRCVIDDYEVEYSRLLIAENNALNFTSVTASGGTAMVKISGISDTNCIVLCDAITTSYIVHPKYISEGSSFAAVFVDSIRETTKYYLSSLSAALLPSSIESFTGSNLRAQLPASDWLAVTASVFHDAVEQYASTIANEYGVTTAVVTVEDIYDSYSYGVFNPEAIRLFLYDFLKNRPQNEQRPSVVLIGDANYNLKEKSPKYGQNYVPGYGFPVSDMLFVAYDSLGIEQQANIGRIPIRSPEDLAAYQARHLKYRAPEYTQWNKTLLLVSGGNTGENDAQLAFYRNINNSIASNSVSPAPFGGTSTHIYKTASPPSAFGEYSEDEARALLVNGGLAISYVGHSATASWDNGIEDPAFIATTETGRPPLVTDFGCSSGKFAEPNLVSFSEKYVSEPGAPGLAYIGNASFGYRSTAQSFPGAFYRVVLQDGVAGLGQAHFLAKKTMIEQFGPTMTVRNAIQMSTLLGDPILELAIPPKPDAAIVASDIAPQLIVFTDALDSLRFTVNVHNYGRVPEDPLRMHVSLIHDGAQIADSTLEMPFPLLSQSLSFVFASPQTTGDFTFSVDLDPSNTIDEISESNNQASFSGAILNSSVKIINRMQTSSGKDTIMVLNPYLNPGPVSEIILESDTRPDFPNPVVARYPYGYIASVISPLPHVSEGEKTYIRLKVDGVNDNYTDTYSIWNGPRLAFYQKDSLDWSLNANSNLVVSNRGITTLPEERSLRVVSAGPFDGSLADVLLNGTSVFPPAAIQGYYVAVFNSDSMTLRTTRTFSTAQSAAEADSLSSFLLSRSENEIIALASSADPTMNRERFTGAFVAIGAKFIDSVAGRGSYCLIGTPGGTAIAEHFTGPMEGAAVIDTALSAPSPTGTSKSYTIGPAGEWKTINTWTEGSLNASQIRVVGVGQDHSEEVLLETLIGQSIDISHIDAATYPWMYLQIQLKNSEFGVPAIRSWGVDYLAAPELAMNYQSVTLDRDSVYEGNSATLSYEWLNAGETALQSHEFAITEVHSVSGEHSATTVPAPSLAPGATERFTHTTGLTGPAGELSVQAGVSASSGSFFDQIAANNGFTRNFSIIPDSSTPRLDYSFDAIVPMDGDFIAAKPVIRLELQPGFSPVLQSDAFLLSIDGQAVLPGDPRVTFTPSGPAEPALLVIKPALQAGTHEFRINAVTSSGIRAYPEDALLNLVVANGTVIRELYPVPNPFSEHTTFSFQLGGQEQPTGAEIKIYTLNGRLIQTLEIPPVQLRIGTNQIHWDGRDADGDRLANGTYFYRLSVTSLAGSVSELGKLSVLR